MVVKQTTPILARFKLQATNFLHQKLSIPLNSPLTFSRLLPLTLISAITLSILPIENYSPVASVHIEEGGVDHARRDGNSYTQLPESVKQLRRHFKI